MRTQTESPETVLATLRTSIDCGVGTIRFDNPPVNVLDFRMIAELQQTLNAWRGDRSIRVIVFESGNPDFFIAHVDMRLIDAEIDVEAIAKTLPQGLNVFQALGEMVRTLPQVTIVKLNGIARGGGAEFVAASDMAFGAIGRAGLGQVEALMGIVPSGGGTQYLSTRMSRGRVLEIVLGADLFGAEEAAAYGWLNRALPADQLDAFVDTLARNIAGLPDGVAQAVKRILPPADLMSGFAREEAEWTDLFAQPASPALMRGGLAAGAQTAEGEKRLEQLLRSVEANRRAT